MRWHDEQGQALVLALAFLIFAGLVVAATLTYAYASELSAQRLGNQRDTVYAADGATDAALQLGRMDSTVGAYADQRCQDPTRAWSATGSILLTTTTNGMSVSVVCTWSPDFLKPDRTDVKFFAFVTGQTVPVVEATATFGDRASGGATPIPVNVTAWTYCVHGPTC